MTSPALVWAPTRTTVLQPPVPGTAPLVAGDRGPDVASYQGLPDWDRVAAHGCKFAFTKATESTTYTNPYFDENWTAIKAAGLIRGTYHFARPEDGPPEPQVDYFLSHVHLDNEYDMLALDVETGHGDLYEWCLRWLNRCRSISGRKAYLYSGPYFMQSRNLCQRGLALAAAGLWLAAYISQRPDVPDGWREITFWQFTDKEVLPGVRGGVDCNIYLP